MIRFSLRIILALSALGLYSCSYTSSAGHPYNGYSYQRSNDFNERAEKAWQTSTQISTYQEKNSIVVPVLVDCQGNQVGIGRAYLSDTPQILPVRESVCSGR